MDWAEVTVLSGLLQTGAIAAGGPCNQLRSDLRVQEAYLGRSAGSAGATTT